MRELGTSRVDDLLGDGKVAAECDSVYTGDLLFRGEVAEERDPTYDHW